MPERDSILLPSGVRLALVLGGGNALRAYHAGLYEALHEAGLQPDWVVGASIGAITGAVIAGNPPEDRVARLRKLWRPETEGSGWPLPWDIVPETWRRTGAVLETLLGGRPGMFGPLGSRLGQLAADRRAGLPALYGTQELNGTLADLVDFDLLNRGPVRFTLAATDIETGEDVIVDTQRQRVAPDHVRASASLLTTFPAIEVEGRLLGDGGLTMNLPLDPVMQDEDPRPILCVASDLLPLAAPRPQTLGMVAARMQDLLFAVQSARSLATWQALFAVRATSMSEDRSITLVSAVYADQQSEVAGKAMDFSPRSVRQRWNCGMADGRALVERLRRGEIEIGKPGLSVHRRASPGR